jgi:zinc transporter, ZIP family
MYLILNVVVLSWAAGLAMWLGALLGRYENIASSWLEQEFRHSVMALGAGALLSAVALVLVPDGLEHLTMVPAVSSFIAGSLSFMALDILLQRIASSGSQLAAMLSDFIPESIALGAAFATGDSHALLLVVLIALQNFPEGFNAYRELSANSNFAASKTLWQFFLMALLGPAAGLIGFYWLAAEPQILAGLMLYASGGILYCIFQDIAPQIKLEKHWGPPLGAILGFVIGMIGLQLLHT